MKDSFLAVFLAVKNLDFLFVFFCFVKIVIFESRDMS